MGAVEDLQLFACNIEDVFRPGLGLILRDLAKCSAMNVMRLSVSDAREVAEREMAQEAVGLATACGQPA